jgi:hypothetical protein
MHQGNEACKSPFKKGQVEECQPALQETITHVGLDKQPQVLQDILPAFAGSPPFLAVNYGWLCFWIWHGLLWGSGNPFLADDDL